MAIQCAFISLPVTSLCLKSHHCQCHSLCSHSHSPSFPHYQNTNQLPITASASISVIVCYCTWLSCTLQPQKCPLAHTKRQPTVICGHFLVAQSTVGTAWKMLEVSKFKASISAMSQHCHSVCNSRLCAWIYFVTHCDSRPL